MTITVFGAAGGIDIDRLLLTEGVVSAFGDAGNGSAGGTTIATALGD